jgi:hypothetical protein
VPFLLALDEMGCTVMASVLGYTLMWIVAIAIYGGLMTGLALLFVAPRRAELPLAKPSARDWT